MAKTPSINLFKDRKSLLEKFITWSLTIGRLIVIATEVIALSAFLYRFSLDRQLIDLHDKIRQKQAIVLSWKGNEAKYRDLQDRLLLASKLSNKGNETTKIFSSIVESTPSDFMTSNLIYSQDRIKIEGDVRSITSLASFIKSIKNQLKPDSISIDKIENKTSSGIIITSLTIKLKTK
ncbi:MAG: hypothetical protein M1268_01665 [Patescibacteria group bacterium]|nr:hypothetical protein [Patescibacteria group bacterium]